MKMNRHGALVALVCVAVSASWAVDAVPQRTVPPEHQGRWVPAKAACDSALAVVVAADRVTFINGKDTEALADAEMSGSGFFGPDYRGIMAVLITEFNGQQPATLNFNVGEKKGVAQVEYSPVMPGNATAPQKAYNTRITTLNLAKRFPLEKMPLKKCAA